MEVHIPHSAFADTTVGAELLVATVWGWEFRLLTWPLLISSWLEEADVPRFCSPHGLHQHAGGVGDGDAVVAGGVAALTLGLL